MPFNEYSEKARMMKDDVLSGMTIREIATKYGYVSSSGVYSLIAAYYPKGSGVRAEIDTKWKELRHKGGLKTAETRWGKKYESD